VSSPSTNRNFRLPSCFMFTFRGNGMTEV